MPILLTSHKPKTQQIDFAELQEQIRCRAHEIYEQRNRTGGTLWMTGCKLKRNSLERQLSSRLSLVFWTRPGIWLWGLA